jgi:AraC family transcriptional activator of pobA
MIKFSGEQPLPFEIRSLEWISENQPEQLATPKRSVGFEIIWVIKASGTCVIDLEKHEMRENTIFCVDAGQLRFLTVSEGMKGYYISFSPQFLYLSDDNIWPLFEAKGYIQGGMARTIPVDEELQIEMDEIMGKMIKEFTNHCLQRSAILKSLLKLLMIYLSRRVCVKSTEMTVNRNAEMVRKFMVLLENTVKTRKMVSEYAGELSVTPNYLNEIVKRITGYTAKYHIQQRKVLEAKRQVIQYGISMKEIAYDLGFDDLAHFSKFFRKNSGVNFTSFRKSYG